MRVTRGTRLETVAALPELDGEAGAAEAALTRKHQTGEYCGRHGDADCPALHLSPRSFVGRSDGQHRS